MPQCGDRSSIREKLVLGVFQAEDEGLKGGDDGVSCQLSQEGIWPRGPHHHAEDLKCCREKTNSGRKPKVTAEPLPPREVA